MCVGVAARYPVDRTRILLTGMSDGATYALLCGLREGMLVKLMREDGAWTGAAERAR